MRNTDALVAFNQTRSLTAATRRAQDAAKALDKVTYPRWRKVLRLRAEHPEASLVELGQMARPRMTKHQYSAALRRALESVQ